MPRIAPLLAAFALVAASGCYQERSVRAGPAEVGRILHDQGWHTVGEHGRKGSAATDFEWQRPVDAPSVLSFGLVFTRHSAVPDGRGSRVVSESYGWSLIPGLFFILPGFLVNVPIPLQDQTANAIDASGLTTPRR
jgi:hypothetical protein